jgi:hypothetical protein
VNQSPFVPAVGWVMPFLALLLSIAILPLAAPHFWESNSRKLTLSALLGLPVVVLYSRHAPEAILHRFRLPLVHGAASKPVHHLGRRHARR